ncbi:MAG: ribbon-helix-helix domain-containing protein [Novosphingobium sp.]
MERFAAPSASGPAANYHPPVKRSVEIAGHKTSVSLEPLFWDMLKMAAALESVPLNALIARIDAERLGAPTPPGLASAIRVWLASRLCSPPDPSG